MSSRLFFQHLGQQFLQLCEISLTDQFLILLSFDILIARFRFFLQLHLCPPLSISVWRTVLGRLPRSWRQAWILGRISKVSMIWLLPSSSLIDYLQPNLLFVRKKRNRVFLCSFSTSPRPLRSPTILASQAPCALRTSSSETGRTKMETTNCSWRRSRPLSKS